MQGVFESGDLTDLVGVKPIYLTKFVERRLYGIRPSAKKGKGRGKRRHFRLDDVYGVALVWWLFESGFRSQAIQYILNQIVHSRRADANTAAKKLIETGARLLVIRRKPRSVREQTAQYPRQWVAIMGEREASKLISADLGVSVQILPVGNLFSNLKKSIKALQLSEQGD